MKHKDAIVSIIEDLPEIAGLSVIGFNKLDENSVSFKAEKNDPPMSTMEINTISMLPGVDYVRVGKINKENPDVVNFTVYLDEEKENYYALSHFLYRTGINTEEDLKEKLSLGVHLVNKNLKNTKKERIYQAKAEFIKYAIKNKWYDTLSLVDDKVGNRLVYIEVAGRWFHSPIQYFKKFNLDELTTPYERGSETYQTPKDFNYTPTHEEVVLINLVEAFLPIINTKYFGEFVKEVLFEKSQLNEKQGEKA